MGWQSDQWSNLADTENHHQRSAFNRLNRRFPTTVILQLCESGPRVNAVTPVQCSELRTMSVRTLATDHVGPCPCLVHAFFKMPHPHPDRLSAKSERRLIGQVGRSRRLQRQTTIGPIHSSCHVRVQTDQKLARTSNSEHCSGFSASSQVNRTVNRYKFDSKLLSLSVASSHQYN